MIIAIDGPAGSGKSTVSKQVASKLGFLYLDTGAMYRCIGLLAQNAGFSVENISDNESELAKIVKNTEIILLPQKDPRKLIHVEMNGKDVTKVIRQRHCDAYASAVAALPKIREILVEKQRMLASTCLNVVLEGRDTATVVFPNADVKIFLVASSEARARRRTLEDYPLLSDLNDTELLERPEYLAILQEINCRDYQDEHRAISPLRKAKNAYEIDSTKLGIDEVVKKIITFAKEKQRESL